MTVEDLQNLLANWLKDFFEHIHSNSDPSQTTAQDFYGGLKKFNLVLDILYKADFSSSIEDEIRPVLNTEIAKILQQIETDLIDTNTISDIVAVKISRVLQTALSRGLYEEVFHPALQVGLTSGDVVAFKTNFAGLLSTLMRDFKLDDVYVDWFHTLITQNLTPIEITELEQARVQRGLPPKFESMVITDPNDVVRLTNILEDASQKFIATLDQPSLIQVISTKVAAADKFIEGEEVKLREELYLESLFIIDTLRALYDDKGRKDSDEYFSKLALRVSKVPANLTMTLELVQKRIAILNEYIEKLKKVVLTVIDSIPNTDPNRELKFQLKSLLFDKIPNTRKIHDAFDAASFDGIVTKLNEFAEAFAAENAAAVNSGKENHAVFVKFNSELYKNGLDAFIELQEWHGILEIMLATGKHTVAEIQPINAATVLKNLDPKALLLSILDRTLDYSDDRRPSAAKFFHVMGCSPQLTSAAINMNSLLNRLCNNFNIPLDKRDPFMLKVSTDVINHHSPQAPATAGPDTISPYTYATGEHHNKKVRQNNRPSF